MAQSTFSPGPPLHMSDLDNTTSTLNASVAPPPRRLQHLSPPRKRRKKRKPDPAVTPDDPANAPPGGKTPSLINRDMLSQLRARLETNEDVSPTPDTKASKKITSTTSSAIFGATNVLVALPSDSKGQDGSVSGDGVSPAGEKKRRDKKRRQKSVLEADNLLHVSPLLQLQQTAVESKEMVSEEPAHALIIPKATPTILVSSDEVPDSAEERKSRRKSKRKERKEALEAEGAVVVSHDSEDPLPSSSDHQIPESTLATDVTELSRKSRELPSLHVITQTTHTHIPATSVTANLPATGAPADSNTGLLSMISEDDIVEEVEDKNDFKGPTYTLPSSKTLSHTKDVIFVERRDGKGFVARKRDSGAKDLEAATPGPDLVITGPGLALEVHKFTQRLALTLHGFIAGLSLWECIVLNILGGDVWSGSHISILEHYHALSLPSHALHFLLLTLVLLSLFDRFDFGRMERLCVLNFIKTPSQIILLAVLFLVMLSLVVTLSMAGIDDRVSLVYNRPDLWSEFFTSINTSLVFPPPLTLTTVHIPSQLEPDILYISSDTVTTSGLLFSYLALTIVRATCSCLSWLGMLWLTRYDRLEDYLIKMMKNSQGIDED